MKSVDAGSGVNGSSRPGKNVAHSSTIKKIEPRMENKKIKKHRGK